MSSQTDLARRNSRHGPNPGVCFMGALKPTLAAVCGALVLSFVGSSRAEQQQTQTFELAVCNLSDFQGVFVALRHKQNTQKWAVDGWYAIPDGGCTFIGSYLRDTIYY